MKLKPEKYKPVCVTARKPPPPPPIPRYGLLKHAAETRPRHTHACRRTQPLHKRCNLVFICMTSERTNQPPAEAFSPLALETKAKRRLQRAAYQLPDIKHTYKPGQTISPPAGNSNTLMWLWRPRTFKLSGILFFIIGFIPLLFLRNPSGLADGGGEEEAHRQPTACLTKKRLRPEA